MRGEQARRIGFAAATQALALLCLATLAAPSQATVLYDQTDSPAPSSSASNKFSDSFGDQTADDFNVPAGESWRIDHVDVAGLYYGSPPQAVNVYLYANGGTVPGPEVFHELTIPSAGPDYSFDVSGAPVLSPGTYWLSVQEDASGGAGSYWSWTNRSIQASAPAVFRGNTGFPCPDWSVKSNCFTVNGPDQIFKLSGLSEPYPPPSPPDTSPPETTISKGPRAQSTKRTAKFIFSSSEPGSTFECKLDKKPSKTCASPMTYKKLMPGKHVFYVAASDVAGNIDPTPAVKKFKIKQ